MRAIPEQAVASLRVEQGRPDEALAALQQSMALWYVPHPDSTQGKEAAAGKVANGGNSGGKRAALTAEELPSYEFRLETVKLLLELEDTIETAAEVHREVLAEKTSVDVVCCLLLLATVRSPSIRMCIEGARMFAGAAGPD